MTDLQQFIQSGSSHVWLYLPVAVLLGALHGLEPGHSKTMMAAFIIAVRGTIWQAVLLGLSAAISHSLIIWVLAALALNYGDHWNAETTEPYFHLASAAMVLSLAVWMFIRTRKEVAEAHAHSHGHSHATDDGHAHRHSHDHHHSHHHHHSHDHHHAAPQTSGTSLILSLNQETSPPAPSQGPHGGVLLDTGHGWLEIAVHEDGVPPRFRIHPCKASGEPVPMPKGTIVAIETARLDGSTQKFQFEPHAQYWESTAILPEPHEFMATVTLSHGDHAHTYRLRFGEASHGHHTSTTAAVETPDDGYQDAHERAHAEEIARRFANRAVTTPQIVLFGITGGLMPCPAAFTILLVCLQIKRVTLGFSMVAAFSFGLALTMVLTGVLAAWSVQKAQRSFSGFGEWMRRAPYISCALLVVLAAFMAWQGWQGLHTGHAH